MSWRKVKLGELVDNFSVRAKDVGGAEGLEFFGVSNEVGITKTKYAAEDKAEDYKIIEQYCFAYNPYRVNVGSIGMVTENTKGLISPAYVVFKPKPNSIKAELLLKFLKSSEGLRQIRFYARGTVRQALRFEDLCNIELSLPDFDEQEILFEKLSSVEVESDLLNTELNYQHDLLKQLRQAFLKEAMKGKLLKQDKKEGNAKELLQKIKEEKTKSGKKEKELPPIKEEEIPFTIPDNWVWCRLGEICNYGSSPKAEPKDLTKSTWVLDLEDIEKETSNLLCKIRFEERNSLSTKSVFQKGEVLYSKLRPYLDKVIVADEDGVCTTEILPLKFYCNIDSYFLRYALKRTDFLNYVNSVTKGMKMPRLGTTEGRMALIPLPPLAEQKRIVKKLEEVMNLCEELKTTITDNQNYTNQLLQVALKDALQMKEVEVEN